jgi:hypothetical protein
MPARNALQNIVLSESTIERIEKLRQSLNTSPAGVIKQVIQELEQRSANFRAIEDDPNNHDLSEEDGVALALEAQCAIRNNRQGLA